MRLRQWSGKIERIDAAVGAEVARTIAEVDMGLETFKSMAQSRMKAPPMDIGAQFRDAMSESAAGVSIIATDGPGGLSGATISSFTSLSMTPPSVIACLHGRSGTLAAIRENGVFSINILNESQAPVAQAFANHRLDRTEQFRAGDWTNLVSAAPVLEEALAHFDCTLMRCFEYGSHAILVGDVVSLGRRPGRPLVYCARDYRRLEDF